MTTINQLNEMPYSTVELLLNAMGLGASVENGRIIAVYKDMEA